MPTPPHHSQLNPLHGTPSASSPRIAPLCKPTELVAMQDTQTVPLSLQLADVLLLLPILLQALLLLLLVLLFS